VSIAGDLGSSYAAQDSGSDTFFFVSGTTGISGASARKSRFGGDVVIGGDLAINGGDVASSSPTVNLLNSATTLNVGNSSTTVNIGSGTVNIGLDNTSVNIDTKTNGFTLLESGAQYLKFSRSSGTAALIRSTEISYPSLYLSGQSVHLDAYSGATWFGSNADERLVIDLSDISNPSIRAKIPSGTPQNLIISGSKVTIGSNNGTTTFDRSGTGFLNVSYNGSTDVTVAANAGANISFGGANASQLSGSFVTLNHGSGQINFQKDGLGFASFSSGSGISVLLTSALGKNFTIGGDSFTSLSGSAVLLNAGNAGFTFQKNGTPFSTISNESGNMLVAPNNQLILRPVSSNTQVTGSVSIKGSIIPDATNSYTLGTDSLRWAHVYTGDLHLRNERGDWTVIEENDFLRIVNNKTGKSYRMMMEPIDN
jgi:hypothetical protein